MPKVFISHTHSDQEIADALNDAMHSLFGDAIEVEYSTKKQIGSGISHGADWFDWIIEQVTDADVALILLTPGSIQKPWILWEAGAVEGVVMGTRDKTGTGDSRLNKVRPLAFHLSAADIPSPFQGKQIRSGDTSQDIELTFEELIMTFANKIPGAAVMKAGKCMHDTVEAYLARVRKALLRAPLLVSESAVQEWLERLDEFEKRPSEIDQLHDWMKVAFGRQEEKQDRPLDLRLHRRLADLYSRRGTLESYRRAARELELARQLAPRDIFVLRQLGNAYVEIEAFDEASGIVNEIESLDKSAFERNIECAALRGKWLRKQKDPRAAVAVYAAALHYNAESYYLANLAAEASLEAGEVGNARQYYEQSLSILERLHEKNIWAWASAANASLALQKEEKAETAIKDIVAAHPSREELNSIQAGLLLVQTRCGLPTSSFETLNDLLLERTSR